MSRKADPVDKLTQRGKSGASVFSRRKSSKVTNLADLSHAELEFARAYSATLKATGWSWRYISDSLNIQGSLIKAWADDEEWQRMVAKVASDVVNGAIDHLNRATIDLVEMLLELARTTLDDAVKLRAIESALDRVGLSKVNKSESKVTNSSREEVAFDEGFMARLAGMPIEFQTKAAQMMQELDAVLAEGAKQS